MHLSCVNSSHSGEGMYHWRGQKQKNPAQMLSVVGEGAVASQQVAVYERLCHFEKVVGGLSSVTALIRVPNSCDLLKEPPGKDLLWWTGIGEGEWAQREVEHIMDSFASPLSQKPSPGIKHTGRGFSLTSLVFRGTSVKFLYIWIYRVKYNMDLLTASKPKNLYESFAFIILHKHCSFKLSIL